MSKTSRSFYISLLCLSTFCFKAQTGISASDAKAAGVNGPVRKVVYRCFYILQNNEAATFNGEPFDYNKYANLIITNVSIYNKQGMAIGAEDENSKRPSSPPVRDYQIIQNGLGKKHDDLNQPIGHTKRSWRYGQTLVYNGFDNNSRLEAEVVRYYDCNFRLDSCITHYEEGSYRKINDHYQYKDSINRPLTSCSSKSL